MQLNSSLSTLLWLIQHSMALVGFWELGTPSERSERSKRSKRSKRRETLTQLGHKDVEEQEVAEVLALVLDLDLTQDQTWFILDPGSDPGSDQIQILDLVQLLTLEDVEEQAEGQVEELLGLVELGQVDLGAVFSCSVEILVAVTVGQPHHLQRSKR